MQPIRSFVWVAAAALLLIALMAARLPREANVAHAAISTPIKLEDPDRACAGCHAAIYTSYEQTSMARGSGLATEAIKPGSFTSSASGVSYRVQVRDGIATLTSRRDSTNAPLNDTERLDYFIGAGLHGRTYLFRRPIPGSNASLWYETPLNWYTQRAAYSMTPAFDKAMTAPLALPTEPNCLHCHTTGVAEPADGVANRLEGPPFRQGGIGCSACHGDMSAHAASGGKTPVLHIAALTPYKQDSVCLQCHLEGDAVVQRAGHTLAQFKPGDDLDDTAVYFVNASASSSANRASSQYEGLLRSACRRAVGERMTCVTCHDPHAEPAPEQRVAFYRGKCLQCHTDTPKFQAATHHPEQQDCAHCHMPSRAASDISHTQNADHDIELRRGSGTLALNDVSHYTAAVDLQPVGSSKPSERELGLAYAQFAAKGDRASFRRAGDLLLKSEQAGHADALVHEQLGFLLQLAQQSAPAMQEYERALAQQPHNVTVETNLAVLKVQSGDAARALLLLKDVADRAPDRTAALLDLTMLQCKAGSMADAKATLKRALLFQPDSVEARLLQSTGDYAGMHCRMF